ncbi:MAG TPA: helicase, partial [Planctomycetaceae bacterium]
PNPEKMPPGPLAHNYLDTELVTRGLITAGDLYPPWDPDIPFEERKYAPPLGEKLRMLFEANYPGVHGVFVQPVWAAGELLNFECNFQNYIGSRDLAKQEGLIFRHMLRLVLLLGEFSQVTPPGMDAALWRGELKELADRLTACCREVDPASTEYMLAHAADQDIVVKEPPAVTGAADVPVSVPETGAEPTDEGIAAEPPIINEFGAGLEGSE